MCVPVAFDMMPTFLASVLYVTATAASIWCVQTGNTVALRCFVCLFKQTHWSAVTTACALQQLHPHTLYSSYVTRGSFLYSAGTGFLAFLLVAVGFQARKSQLLCMSVSKRVLKKMCTLVTAYSFSWITC